VALTKRCHFFAYKRNLVADWSVRHTEDSFMLCHLDQENLIESTPFTDRASGIPIHFPCTRLVAHGTAAFSVHDHHGQGLAPALRAHPGDL
jgi:hypothetical protein